jgi:hypothetical protein
MACFKPIQYYLMTFALGVLTTANATDIDPRAYSNIPVGLNFHVTAYNRTMGNIAVAPTVPIKNAELGIHNAVFAYARSLDIFGYSGKVDFILPMASLYGTAEVQGEPRSRNINGFADSMARFYVNLYGAPALSMREFTNYQQDLIIGASLSVVMPTGQYNPEKLVNLGTNRWAFKPELGLSKAWGDFTAELATGAYFFTDNNQPFMGNTLKQVPIFTTQGHLIYNIAKGVWLAFDANYYIGGETIKDGKLSSETTENLRLGGTFSFPIHKQHSIKLFGSSNVYSRTNSGFDNFGIAWQYRWGEGL